jgi:hypothetical protein
MANALKENISITNLDLCSKLFFFCAEKKGNSIEGGSAIANLLTETKNLTTLELDGKYFFSRDFSPASKAT